MTGVQTCALPIFARSQGDNTKQPLRIQDFVMQPVNYNYTRESVQFGSKQEVIDHFVRQGKSAAAGAAAWEKGWRGPKIKTAKHQPPKAPEPQQQQRYWWQDKEDLEEGDVVAFPKSANVGQQKTVARKQGNITPLRKAAKPEPRVKITKMHKGRLLHKATLSMMYTKKLLE